MKIKLKNIRYKKGGRQKSKMQRKNALVSLVGIKKSKTGRVGLNVDQIYLSYK